VLSIEQIVAVLKQAELGMPVADVIRQVGIMVRPALRRDLVDYGVSPYGLMMRRTCRLVNQPRSVQYY
jgi:hypothetical protein